MNEPRLPFATSVKELVATARRQAGPPASPDELFAFLDGELSPEDSESFRDRLVLYPESCRAALDLLQLSRLESRDNLPDEQTAGHVPTWEAMAALLAEDEEVELSRRTAENVPRRWPVWSLLAAVLVLAIVGFWVRSLLMVPASQPQVNVYATPLLSVDVQQRSPVIWRTVKVSRHSPYFGLSLSPGEVEIFAEYQVNITMEEGASVWSSRGLHPGPEGTFELVFPRDFFVPGRYRVQLEGLEDEARENLATFRMEIVFD